MNMGDPPLFPAVAEERGGVVVGLLGGRVICVVSKGRVQGRVGVFPGWSRPSIRYAVSHLIISLCLRLILLMDLPRFIIFIFPAFASTLFLPFSANIYISQLFTLLHSLTEILMP